MSNSDPAVKESSVSTSKQSKQTKGKSTFPVKEVSGQSTPSSTEIVSEGTPKGGTKRALTSPLQPALSQPEKKTRPKFDSVSDTEIDPTLHELPGDTDDDMDDDTNGEECPAPEPIPEPGNVAVTHYVSQPMNPSDILSIAHELKQIMLPEIKQTVRDEIPDIETIVHNAVQSAVKAVTDVMDQKIEQLAADNVILRKDNENLVKLCSNLENRVAKLEASNDALEQYSRRNSVRISGIPQREQEDTDKIVLDVARSMDVPLDITDIDRSHRVGSDKNRRRDILVKFMSYRARQSLLTERKKLRNTEGMKDVFINEDLTSSRSKLLFDARRLVKAKVLKSAYSADGRILVRDFADKRYLIQDETDLNKHGDPDQPVGASAGAWASASATAQTGKRFGPDYILRDRREEAMS